MRLSCPLCGERDRREFYFRGAALARPEGDASDAAWDAYMHLRDNVAGPQAEFWCHEGGCGAWLVVTRNIANHEVEAVTLAGTWAETSSEAAD